jgi:hypothetical protein
MRQGQVTMMAISRYYAMVDSDARPSMTSANQLSHDIDPEPIDLVAMVAA